MGSANYFAYNQEIIKVFIRLEIKVYKHRFVATFILEIWEQIFIIWLKIKEYE